MRRQREPTRKLNVPQASQHAGSKLGNWRRPGVALPVRRAVNVGHTHSPIHTILQCDRVLYALTPTPTRRTHNRAAHEGSCRTIAEDNQRGTAERTTRPDDAKLGTLETWADVAAGSESWRAVKWR